MVPTSFDVLLQNQFCVNFEYLFILNMRATCKEIIFVMSP